MPAIICSEQCAASQNIKERLIERGFSPLSHEKFKCWGKDDTLMVEVPDKLIEIEYLDEYFATDCYIFASKHRSESGKPSLTVHSCGNWGPEAVVGGKPRSLSFSSPIPKKLAFQFISAHPIEGFEIALECTHHGPTEMKTPLFFIEIGSTEKEWENKIAGKIIAEAILHVCAEQQKTFRIAIGAGGTHYCPSFSKLENESDIAFGHIIPNYAIEQLQEDTFLQAIEKSKADLLVLDWKGLKGSQREKITSFAKNAGIELTSDKELRKASPNKAI
jgi:D-aminoacyl-tRNA deacylase